MQMGVESVDARIRRSLNPDFQQLCNPGRVILNPVSLCWRVCKITIIVLASWGYDEG